MKEWELKVKSPNGDFVEIDSQSTYPNRAKYNVKDFSITKKIRLYGRCGNSCDQPNHLAVLHIYLYGISFREITQCKLLSSICMSIHIFFVIAK